VTDYRCFLLNERGMIMKAEVISAASDADAIVMAEELFRAQGSRYGGFELWQLGRVVHKSTPGRG
jgi:hypothetical protein